MTHSKNGAFQRHIQKRTHSKNSTFKKEHIPNTAHSKKGKIQKEHIPKKARLKKSTLKGCMSKKIFRIHDKKQNPTRAHLKFC